MRTTPPSGSDAAPDLRSEVADSALLLGLAAVPVLLGVVLTALGLRG